MCVLTFSTFAQKDELKKLKKIYDKDVPSAKDVEEFKANVVSLEGVAKEESDKMALAYYKVNIPQLELAAKGAMPMPTDIQKTYTPSYISELAKVYSSILDYEKTAGKKTFTDQINAKFEQSKPIMLNLAIELGNQKKYKESASILYSLYEMDKTDQDQLYYAASYATNGMDYDKAIEYYNELIRLKYTGEGMVYYAVNKAKNLEESFGEAKSTRDTFVKTGQYENPRDEKVPSKKGEIYKNRALILVQQDKVEEAKSAVANARLENPDDDSLILTEADLYLKLKDFEGYSRVVKQALEKNPNNADLVFNLGVISTNSDKLEVAITYYKRAMEIDPNYFNAYINLSELIIRKDEKFVEEMNKLGTSEKDNKRYAVVKAEREANFKKVLPYLEKALELKPDNDGALRTLMGVYNALEMTDKYKAIKAKIKN
jgi:tetratricopeptide (TPR) repeat protein